MSYFVLPHFNRRIPFHYCSPFGCHHLIKTFAPTRHESSNEKQVMLPKWAWAPESTKRGVWSDPALVNAWTETRGNFCSHSVVAKIVSNFWYVEISLIFAQVYCLPISSTAFSSKLWLIALNMIGHRGLYMALFFSLGFRSMIKFPPTNIGNDFHIIRLTLVKT